MHLKIKQLPNDERPYEKFLKYGLDSLTDTELVSIIIKTGTKDLTSMDLAREVISKDNLSTSLANLYTKSYEELKQIKGIGEVKALTLKCVAEISRRLSISTYTSDKKFNTPSLVADYYMESLRYLDHEEFIVLFLDSLNKFISSRVMSKGTKNQSLVSLQDVFSNALKLNASGFVLVHNHPSGNPTPSSEDISVTEKFLDASKILGIDILDHIIIGDKKYISFRECGIVFDNKV